MFAGVYGANRSAVSPEWLLGDLDEGDFHGVGAGFMVGGDVPAGGYGEGLDAGGLLRDQRL